MNRECRNCKSFVPMKLDEIVKNRIAASKSGNPIAPFGSGICSCLDAVFADNDWDEMLKPSRWVDGSYLCENWEAYK